MIRATSTWPSSGATATALDVTQSNVKVTHHRARAAMKGYETSRVRPTRELQARTAERLRTFLACLQRQDVPCRIPAARV